MGDQTQRIVGSRRGELAEVGEAIVTRPGDVETESAAASLIGSVVDKRYRIDALLAVGGMGAVYRAEQVFIHRRVALKLLHTTFATDPEAVLRFHREAQIAARLRSPHVVEVLDFGRTEEGRFFLTMELLAGESLQSLIEREGRLSPVRVSSLLRQLLSVLGAAHAAGIVHRDLKPENLWLCPADASTGAPEQLKILDFGIAKLVEASSLGGSSSSRRDRTQAGLVMGTPEYLAPEQAFGQSLDHRADLYAVGLIAFVLLTGRHPFKGKSARALMVAHAITPVPDLKQVLPALRAHPGLCELVRCASQKEPNERPENALAMLAILDRIPIRAKRTKPTVIEWWRSLPWRTRTQLYGACLFTFSILVVCLTAGIARDRFALSRAGQTIRHSAALPAPRMQAPPTIKLLPVASPIVPVNEVAAPLPSRRRIHPR